MTARGELCGFGDTIALLRPHSS